MEQLLQLFIWIPFLGFLISLCVPRKKEFPISIIAISTAGLHLIGMIALTTFWLIQGHATLDIKHITLFQTGNIEIFIDFYFDHITATFAGVGSLLTFLVTIFSRYYLHREAGFKRFFVTILFFFLGYNLVVLSGNFETLFIGWEILGICSFLLVAFYRDRYLPVKNGLKVISFYRLADVCLVLAMWMSHHLWHQNITFAKLNDVTYLGDIIQQHYPLSMFIAVTILLAAAIKSAQLPFSSWLPRAMEGPTTSSAIFYGSLSVHLGVFILLRTFPFWQDLAIIKIAVIVIGLTTSVIATGIARVQSTVKTQIAYSSAAQIGFIFIEVALGLHWLALIHFAGNAFLRTYQLLMSPSVLSYLVHDQFYNFIPEKRISKDSFFTRIKHSFYVLCVKEWNIDFMLTRFLWNPFKAIGNRLGFLSTGVTLIALIVFFISGGYAFFMKDKLPFHDALPTVYSFLSLVLILKAFTERSDAKRALLLVFGAQLFIALSIALNKEFDLSQIAIYLSGGIVSTIVGFICLTKIKAIDNDITLDRFHGYSYERPGIAAVFLLACLGLVAFPITPAFIGFDVLLTHIREDQIAMISATSLCFIFIELSVLRIYARIFLGQHKKAYHAIAYRSS
jgi:NADH-quinone oxidoreductase subunit L